VKFQLTSKAMNSSARLLVILFTRYLVTLFTRYLVNLSTR